MNFFMKKAVFTLLFMMISMNLFEHYMVEVLNFKTYNNRKEHA